MADSFPPMDNTHAGAPHILAAALSDLPELSGPLLQAGALILAPFVFFAVGWLVRRLARGRRGRRPAKGREPH